MVQPIDYSINVQSPFEAAVKGYEFGAAIRDDRAAFEQKQAAMQQAAEQMALQQQQQQRLMAAQEAFMNDPNESNITRLMVLDPKSSEALNRAWEIRDTVQQRSLTSDLLKWEYAIKSGRPDVAAEQLVARADALDEQSGAATQETQAMRAQAKGIMANPTFALGQIRAMLEMSPLAKDIAESRGKFGTERREEALHPEALETAKATTKKTQSEAATKEIEAEFARSNALADLEKRGWETKKLMADTALAREQKRLATMRGVVDKTEDPLKRRKLQLEVAKAENELETSILDRAAQTTGALDTLDNMINTGESLLKATGLRDVVGAFEGAEKYPTRVAGALNVLNPFTSSIDERMDALALVEVFKSQVFLKEAYKMRGLGHLTVVEGERLIKSIQSLNTAQSEDKFVANVKEIIRLTKAARDTMARKAGAPAGSPPVGRQPEQGQASPPPLSEFRSGGVHGL